MKEDGFIDARNFGNLLRYANHSSEANVDVKTCNNLGQSQIMFVAKKKIKIEQEILIDYGKNFFKK